MKLSKIKEKRSIQSLIRIPILRRDNKKAWLRIVEAFIAVMIVMTTLLIIVNKQKIYVEQEQQKELAADQEFILEQIRYDPEIKNIILSGDEAAFREKIYPYIPEGYSYSVRICPVNDICSQGDLYVPGEVFSNEIIIASNLTTYNPRLAKVFYWLGEMPEGECFNECTLNEKRCQDASSYIVCRDYDEDGCTERGTAQQAIACPTATPDCVEGECVKKVGKLTLTFTNINYVWNSGWHYYYHTRTFTETGGVGVTLTSGQLCYQSTGKCDSAGINYRIGSSSTLITPKSPNEEFHTPSTSDKFTLKYWGTDDKGNAVYVEQSMTVAGASYSSP